MANSIIRHLDIITDDVIFICARGIRPQLNFICISDNNYVNDFEKVNYWNFFNFYSKIEQIDKFFQSEISSTYNLYIPHLANPFFQILASSKNCNSIIIFEEGVNCLSQKLYSHNNSFKRKCIDYLFNYTGIYGKHRFYYVSNNFDDRFLLLKIDTLYAITPNAFTNYKLKPQIIKHSIQGLNSLKTSIENNSVLLIFEGIVDQNNLLEATLLKSLTILLSQVNENEIKVKFHPAQKKISRLKITKILNQYKNVEFIDDNAILEIILITKKNLKVYGFTSSLLHYGKIFGHEIISFAHLWNDDPLYKHFRKYNDFQI